MSDKPAVTIFGETLIDCFPDGQEVMGGAPFNVAWHLQAFGDQPCLISRVGNDAHGADILHAMKSWGMDSNGMQIDAQHPTGRVDVTLQDNEPSYSITPDCAYDFTDADIIPPITKGVLYHGTLALRNPVARNAFNKLLANADLSIFLDVNLRQPWWQAEDVFGWIKQAHWVKLNHDELTQLGIVIDDRNRDLAQFQNEYEIDLLIVTYGEEGAVVRTRQGQLHQVRPSPAQHFVDTVGAGDAFTATFLHGLLAGWTIAETINAAQDFASAVVGQRGAISTDPEFYTSFNY